MKGVELLESVSRLTNDAPKTLDVLFDGGPIDLTELNLLEEAVEVAPSRVLLVLNYDDLPMGTGQCVLSRLF